MTIGKRSKLTLGLKRKPEENPSHHEEDSIEKQAKLALGVRKKREWKPLEEDTANDKPNQLVTLGLKKKTDVIFQKTVENRPPIQAINRPRSAFGLRRRPGIIRTDADRVRPQGKPTVIKIPKTKGKLEINIKINQLPTQSQTIKRGWQRFYVNVEGQIVQMKVRPRTWNKLLKANEEYPTWVASITGKMGHRIKDGFELLEPSIQVYEKKVDVPSESSPETPEE
jgi:hypothetical protein